MGTCGGKAQTKRKYTLTIPLQNKCSIYLQVVNRIELDLLHLIFEDLSSRNDNNEITKTSFTDFFTMIGLWGDLVFDYFNHEQNNKVNFEQFIKGVEYFIKCNEEQKIEHLFKLYDLDKEGTIKKDAFLQMLQNYPREDLIKLLDDATFLEDEQILKYHEKKLKSVNKQKPLKSTEQDANEQLSQIVQRRNSRSSRQEGSSISQTDLNQPYRQESVNMMFPNPSMVGINGVPMGDFGQNVTFNVNGQTVELKRVNINYLVKKYVNMIYKRKQNQELSIDEFRQFVKLHPKIFNGLYKAFNHDIWGLDEQSQLPRLTIVSKDLEGVVYKQCSHNKPSKERHFKLIQHFCLSFKSKIAQLPSKIYCLDGLVIQELVDEKTQKYGFTISHKDAVYKQRTFHCSTFEDFKKWTNNLQTFQKAQVNDYYSILQKIGEGKFSIVYLCEDKKSKEKYAIKIIEKFKLSKSEKLMLAHETEIMKLLNHSCIIKFKEMIETKTHLNIITEMVADGDLFDYIQKQDILCEQEASLIMSQLFDTIHYVHSIGIVHRDLKPENIMIVLDSSRQKIKNVKIIDFGFANYLSNIQSKESEAICGTTNYLAPESLESRKLSFKVDNFSLGVILYLMLSGYLPFDSEFPEEIIKNIMDCKLDLTDDFWKAISEEAKDLVKRLLQKDPDNRISMADAMLHPWIVVIYHLSRIERTFLRRRPRKSSRNTLSSDLYQLYHFKEKQTRMFADLLLSFCCSKRQKNDPVPDAPSQKEIEVKEEDVEQPRPAIEQPKQRVDTSDEMRQKFYENQLQQRLQKNTKTSLEMECNDIRNLVEPVDTYLQLSDNKQQQGSWEQLELNNQLASLGQLANSSNQSFYRNGSKESQFAKQNSNGSQHLQQSMNNNILLQMSVFNNYLPPIQEHPTPDLTRSKSFSNLEQIRTKKIKKDKQVQKQKTIITTNTVAKLWDEREDQLLKRYYLEFNGNWKKIAEQIEGRNMNQCAQRWRRLHPQQAKNKWSMEEDHKILQLVEVKGKNWVEIARSFPNRTGKQIRERYLNKLDPSINNGPWTPVEDDIILAVFKENGNKWSIAAKQYKENMVKNRFYSYIRRVVLKQQNPYQVVFRPPGEGESQESGSVKQGAFSMDHSPSFTGSSYMPSMDLDYEMEEEDEEIIEGQFKI